MSRYLAAIALLLVVVLPAIGFTAGGSSAPPPPEQVAQPALVPPPPSPTVAPTFREAVFGDFALAGNSVLRCPVDDEVSGDNPPADCAAAVVGDQPSGSALLDNSGNNNGYYMHLAGGDGPDTFDASSAALTVPEGATVRYAQLNWGGHTGTFIGFSGVNCVRPLLLQGEPPPPPAAAAPAQQQVRLAVGGAAAAPVARDPAHFRTTDGLTEPSQVYTDWADVTGSFDGVATGSPVELSVSNVWAPTGPGCAGGWSIVVVFDYGAPHAGYETPRVVDLYNDELPRSGALLPGLVEPLLPGVPSIIDGLLPGLVPALTGTRVILPGVNPRRSAANVAIGLTAYDGDWRQGGETFTVDGDPVTEPCSGAGTEDFFRSCAEGSGVRNNLSVDAKTVRPELADNDTGDIEIGVGSVSDFVVVQNVVLSESVDPAVSLTMTGPATPVEQGRLATFELDIRNDGGLPLTDVELTTSATAADGIRCTPAALPPLAPGATTHVTCMQPARVLPSFTTSATVTASYLLGSSGTPHTVSATQSATVDVVAAPYTLERVPDRLVARAGGPVTFAVTLTNNTATDLADLTYTDEAAPDCVAPAAVLAAGQSLSFDCVATAPAESFWSTGTMTGNAGQVTVTSDRVLVSVIDPVVTVSTSAAKDTIYRGDSVELTFTVTNGGDAPDETLSNLQAGAGDLCVPAPIAALGPGESATVTCVATPVATREIVATVTAHDVNGDEVLGTAAPVTVTVLEPLIELTQTVDVPTVRVGDEVTIEFTVTNVGADGPVTDVRITSPTLPPDCLPDPVATLAPGDSTSATCTATPDRTFDNQAFASAVDQVQRPMKVGTTPLRVTVINPALTIATTAEPPEAKHGEEVDFAVTVRNIGDVPMTVEVKNDKAPDCDFDLTGEGLRAGAANGVRCTVTTPTDEATTELTNNATYSADPLESTGDTGEPLTGADDAIVALVAGQAPEPPAPGPDPVTGDGVSGGSVGGGAGGSGGGGSGAGGAKKDDDLAWTGVNVALPIGLGVSLLILGTLTMVATSRRRHDEDSALYRWWPGD